MNELCLDAVFLLVLFVSNVIQAITGFAGTVLAMPASMLLIGADEARVVLNMMALLSCLWIGVQHKTHIRWHVLARMVAGMAVGMIAGMAIYSFMPLGPLQKAYGIFIIVVAVKNLFAPLHENAETLAHDHCFAGSRSDTRHVCVGRRFTGGGRGGDIA